MGPKESRSNLADDHDLARRAATAVCEGRNGVIEGVNRVDDRLNIAVLNEPIEPLGDCPVANSIL